MRIEIGRYVLKSDSHCFILAESEKGGKAKDGSKDYDKIIGYYTTIESVLKAVPERALMASDATTLQELVCEIKKYQEIIERELR